MPPLSCHVDHHIFFSQSKEFVRRLTEVAALLAALEKEADGEAAKYGNDIVFMAEFANSRGPVMSWITVSSSTQGTLPTLRGFEAGFDSLAAL